MEYAFMNGAEKEDDGRAARTIAVNNQPHRVKSGPTKTRTDRGAKTGRKSAGALPVTHKANVEVRAEGQRFLSMPDGAWTKVIAQKFLAGTEMTIVIHRATPCPPDPKF